MTTTIASFLDTIRESRLLEPARLEELLRTPDVQADGVDATMLGQCLVQLGWLTTYQVEELLKGQLGGLIVGPYRLLERLGESTFGPAFKARHPDKDGRFAVKLILPEKIAEGGRERLLADVRRASQLAHPNVARVSEPEVQGDRLVYAREYVEGMDLGRLVQHGPLPPAHASDYIHQAAQGLQHCHERGLVHGHVQPSNLVVAYSTSLVSAANAESSPAAGLPPPGAVLKVVDCGLASLHHAQPPQPHQDLAGLGRTLALLLTGSADGEPPADLPGPLRDILRRLRADKVDERFASMADLIQALAPLCGAEPALAEEAAVGVPVLDLTAAPAVEAPIPPAVPPASATPPAPMAFPAPAAIPAATPITPTPILAPMMAAPMAPAVEAEEAPPATPPGKRRKEWTTRDWLLVGIGLVLHVFAAIIIIVLVMNYMNSSPGKGGQPPRPTAPRPKPANKPMGSLEKPLPFTSFA